MLSKAVSLPLESIQPEEKFLTCNGEWDNIGIIVTARYIKAKKLNAAIDKYLKMFINLLLSCKSRPPIRKIKLTIV